MTAESVDQLIALFKNVASHTQDLEIKLAALERTIRQYPELNAQYQEWVGKLRFIPNARAERQKTAEAFEVLRQALLQDAKDGSVLRAAAATHL